MYRQYPVEFYQIIFVFFWIGETCVKKIILTLERELTCTSCLTGLTSSAFISRLPDLFQFYLNQWKHFFY